MDNANTNILEGMISSYLNTKYPDIPPLEADFDKEVDSLRQLFAPMYPVSDDDFFAIKRRLRTNIAVQGVQGVLIKNKKQHIPWLNSRRKELDFYFGYVR